MEEPSKMIIKQCLWCKKDFETIDIEPELKNAACCSFECGKKQTNKVYVENATLRDTDIVISIPTRQLNEILNNLPHTKQWMFIDKDGGAYKAFGVRGYEDKDGVAMRVFITSNYEKIEG
jgi:hypothetical protein